MDSDQPAAASDPPDHGAGTNIFGQEELGHFIPFRKADIVEMCCADGALPADTHESFREFCKILSALFHFEYHERLEALKDNFAPFNPDTDTRLEGALSPEQRVEKEQQFMTRLQEVLVGANYTELSREELQANLDSESRFKVRLKVDLDDFAEMMLFVRGKHERMEIEKKLHGLRKREVPVTYYERVAVYIRFKGEDHFKAKKLKDVPFKPGESYLKLFKDIPIDDLEIVFPNVRMSMRLFDKLLVGIPAAVGGLVVLITKLGTALLVVMGLILFWLGIRKVEPKIGQHHLVALGLGLATLGGFIFRQITKIKNRRLKYLKSLSESLYFKVLDNNAGVFDHLTDAAEEEDNKEAVLAYYFILTRGGKLSEDELDAEVERWFAEKHDVQLDFEVDDAMAKLERLGLAWRDAAALRVKPLTQAKERIDYIWDNYFTYNE